LNIPPSAARDLVNATAVDPCQWLGMHAVGCAGSKASSAVPGLAVRVLWPGARRIEVLAVDKLGACRPGKVLTVLARSHPAGLFEGLIADQRDPLPYRLRVVDAHGDVHVVDDAYRFGSMLADPTRDYARDLDQFAAGTHDAAQEFLGAHEVSVAGVRGVRFAVWAPNASSVSVIGDFNAWDPRCHMLRNHPVCGVWELFVPAVNAGARYKFSVLSGEHLTEHRQRRDKADPYARAAERPPANASVVVANEAFGLASAPWNNDRAAANDRHAPVSIYEVHAGSWRRHDDGSYLNWDELAQALIPYACDLNFTHLQFMPIAEYPFSGSWGYQPISLFAPSSRFGDVDGFRRFVEVAHRSGLGVLLDWVPAHFPKDAHGLTEFDGTHLFEHAHPQRREHPDWGTLIYNYSRHEIRSFLFSAAQYWLDYFKLDGLRVDAVASMLYLDYSRKEDEWQPNEHGGRENLEAVDFIRELNVRTHRNRPGVMMVAEESTAWAGVTRPADQGGLGFGYKWNMGWMNDTLSYFSQDPIHRSYHHNALTFSMVYAFDENFVLPFSHDEVVHGKGSMLSKMPGDRWQQFANLRACYGYMWAHPGKKLLFMGSEFGQPAEWSHNAQLDWPVLAGHDHRGLQSLVRDLNALYRAQPALHHGDCVAGSFVWLDVDNAQDSVIAFARTVPASNQSSTGELCIVVCNLTPVVRHNYRIGVPRPGQYDELLNTDAACYGGSDVGNACGMNSEDVACRGFDQSVVATLPPLATCVFRWGG